MCKYISSYVCQYTADTSRRLRRLPSSITVAALVTMATACSDFDTRPLTGLEATEANERAGAAITLLKSCPVAGPAPAPTAPAPPQNNGAAETAAVGVAAAILVPIAADFVTTLIGKAIQESQDGLSGQFVASGVTTDLQTDLKSGCLVIYRGLFGKMAPTASDKDLKPHLKELGLVDMPAFYMEAHTTLNAGVLTLEPKYVRYAQSSARRDGSGMKHVGIVLALTERQLSATDDAPADKEAIALFRLDLGRLKIGRSYLHTAESQVLTGTKAIQTLPESDSAAPANLFAYVIESEEPGPALQALSEAFTSQEDGLTTALSDFLSGLLPEEEESAAEEEDSTAEEDQS